MKSNKEKFEELLEKACILYSEELYKEDEKKFKESQKAIKKSKKKSIKK